MTARVSSQGVAQALDPLLDPFVASLLARAPAMSFMQLCRLLELRMPDRPGFGTQGTPEFEPVRFRPRQRVGFPAGEVACVDLDDEGPGSAPTVRTTFMGLYGVDAAMPSHLIDDIVLREEGHEAVEAFLDQFNHRFATLLYRAWKKYRYPIGFRAGGVDDHSRNLLCLAGFGWGGKPARAGLPDSRALALLGLLIQRTRTAEGLAGVVALAVPGVEVRVDEFHATLKPVGKPTPLGCVAEAGRAPPGLGGGVVLGTRLAYRGSAVRVTLRPVDARQSHELLPGAALHRELTACLKLYVGVKADVLLQMEMSSCWAPAPVVGASHEGPAPRLAWTVVLPSSAERLITIPLGVCEAFPSSADNPFLDAECVT
ncbi:type VI secretion system baseplate subunit TssG [Paraburkholderia bryophila]|uniref:type VI secretion system baseplate subunit TssG n=1 Tax=Paraburkholderia bryophila TaxID=420952 RepID=UPI00234B204F|nr:type VI secretion system baseplate subunit TssG [Paraburkholderia bryophila]WCM21663.1 type VI secretion system baseplate subunit TssG [Paraburkholderia bryophila]